ncbi:aminoglycoside phosphotransferase family protein [Paenibacillus sp. FSL H8-0259]|uniref:aminoglycoside phosphotransferase family protein n=1 Tax=Paenibacillus sp. FSL H8-0259 TaxID=1920423 RepID=UPI0009FA4424|nr:aminoglycoside phosphotransferase family protein [Paenibacillus sp. FSL H8-0259]
MNNVLSNIRWKEQSAEYEAILQRADEAVITPLEGGLEAEVYRVTLPDTELVFKIWNRDSRPDISIQYKVLEQMYRQGRAVSQPYAWGLDPGDNQVLLTSFDGVPLTEANTTVLTAIAENLLDIHRLPLDSLSGIEVPAYDFADYFFPEWGGQPEIRMLALGLADKAGITSHHLIHGDYHAGNILEAAEAYTIIDWTNVQLGDPRYDIAWSILIIRVYAGEQYAEVYRSAFLAKSSYTAAELELFEALACLRWLQLYRTTGIPLQPDTLAMMQAILERNGYLPEGLL